MLKETEMRQRENKSMNWGGRQTGAQILALSTNFFYLKMIQWLLTFKVAITGK